MSYQKITKEEFLQLLKQYNFTNNSVRSFSKLYGVHYNTVAKYLRENNINYNRKESNIIRSRNPNGKFSLSISIQSRNVPQKINKDSKQKIQTNESVEDKIKYLRNSLKN